MNKTPTFIALIAAINFQCIEVIAQSLTYKLSSNKKIETVKYDSLILSISKDFTTKQEAGVRTFYYPNSESLYNGVVLVSFENNNKALEGEFKDGLMTGTWKTFFTTGELMLPEVRSGMTDASTTRKPDVPRTHSFESTTAMGSESTPILQVPAG